MELNIKGTRYEPTPENEAQVKEQIGSLDRFIDESKSKANAFVELSQEVGGQNKGDIWRAELMIEHEGKTYRAESIKAKLSHAITTVARDVGRELRRAKGREHVFLRKGGAAVKGFLRGFKSK